MKNRKSVGVLILGWLLVLSLAVLGCSSDHGATHLDVAPTPPDTASAEEKWLHQLQMLTVVDKDGKPTSQINADRVYDEIAMSLDCGYDNTAPSTWTCPQFLANAVNNYLCAGKTMLAAATTQAQPVHYREGITDFYIPPQSEETAEHLAELAIMGARQAIMEISSGHQSAPCSTHLGDPGILVGFTSALADAYQLGKDGYDRAIQASMNVADKMRTTTSSPGLAASRSVSGSSLSRAAAAHLLVGGDPGLLGSTTTPLCNDPELRPEEKTALQLLRDSGVAPTDVMNAAMTIGALVDGTGGGTQPAAGSVRARLNQFYNYPELTGTSAQTVEQYYKLSTDNFTAARSYLQEEITAFGRLSNAQLPAEPAFPTGFRRYAGTATEPKALPPVAWAARARYQTSGPGTFTVLSSFDLMNLGLFDTTTESAHYGLAQFIDVSTFLARIMLAKEATFPAAVTAAAMAPLAAITSSGEYRGELLNQPNTTAGGFYAVTTMNFKTTDRLRVVVGEDGLRCAVQGSVEGAACADPAVGTPPAYPCAATAAPSLACSTLVAINGTTSAAGFGGTVASVTGARQISTVLDPKTRLYFVQPRSPTSPETPGQFVALAGFTVSDVWVPVVPLVDSRVADVLAPSKRFCAMSQVSCAGVSMDERLPLEDELTNDNDGVESSWKHYLALAQQAATEADTLGQDYLQQQISATGAQADADVRQEQQIEQASEALEKVQSECGTAIDSRKLLSVLVGADGGTILSGTSNQACDPTTAGNPCGTGFVCTGGRCVMNMTEVAKLFPTDPEIGRLARCLDTSVDANVSFLTLGDRGLCVAVDATDPNVLCPAAGVKPCLQPKTGATCPAGTADVSPLGYFKYDNTTVPTGVCDNLRALRTTPGNSVAMDRLWNSGALHPTRIAQLIDSIEYQVGYGPYSTIVVDGAPKYTTGNSTNGPNTSWPCGTVAPTAGCTDPDTHAPLTGLFCSVADCSPTASINMMPLAKMNARLLRASLAAQAMLATTKSDQLLNYAGTADAVLPGGGCTANQAATTTTLYHFSSNQPLWQCSTPLRRPGTSSKTFSVSLGTEPTNVGWADYDPTANVYTPLLLTTASGMQVVPGGYALSASRQFGKSYFFDGLSSFGQPDPQGWTMDVLRGARDRNDMGISFSVSGGYMSPGGKLNGDNLLDGLELICEIESSKAGFATSRPPSITSFEDLDNAGAYLQQLAASVEQTAAARVFAHVPKLAADALREVSAGGAFPELGGQMAEQVSSLREAILKSREAIPGIVGEMNQFGAELRGLRALLEKSDVQKQISDYQFASTVTDRLTQCASAISNVASDITSFGASSAIQCANSIAQIAFATQINTLQKQSSDLDKDIEKSDFSGKMSQHARNLQLSALQLSEAMEQIDIALAGIDSLRKDAAVQIAKAVYLASFQSQNQAANLKVQGVLATAKKKRYEVALSNAQTMAFLAKRSIEQRLGVSLSEMRDPLPLVPAPSTWQDSVCTLTGIDYAALKDGNTANYTDGFIGDYVNKLSNLVEGYRIQNNFHEGKDVAIVSLRDDVLNVRKPCSVPADNLFAESARLDDVGYWLPTGCNPVTLNGVTSTGYNCMTVLNTKETPLQVFDSQMSGTTGYQLRFGDGKGCLNTTGPNVCGWKTGASLAQTVTLAPGNYRLTWYTKEAKGVGAASNTVVSIVPPSGAVPALTWDVVAPTRVGDWNRAWATFPVTVAGAYKIGFGVTAATAPTAVYTLAAPMLEQLPANTSDVALRSFQKTAVDGTTQLAVCEDQDGTLFRATNWQPGCVRLCDAGFSNNCTDGPLACYRDVSFGVSQSAIQNGKLFNFSGFARGNFNYRIDTIGLNFVGTGIRDCSQSNLPSTCNGGAFVTYSLQHDGPFYVRNFDGADFRAFLFDGRIEQARGLASERYITNPLSESDRGLLSDYLRQEFQGRPLDGNFVLRVWDDPAVKFDAIQDIQLVLNYSYWTRFQ